MRGNGRECEGKGEGLRCRRGGGGERTGERGRREGG